MGGCDFTGIRLGGDKVAQSSSIVNTEQEGYRSLGSRSR